MGASITKRDSSVFVSGENINKSDIHIKKEGFVDFIINIKSITYHKMIIFCFADVETTKRCMQSNCSG